MGIEPSYNTHTTLALFSCDIIAKAMSMTKIPNLNKLVENGGDFEHMTIFTFKV